MVLAKKWVLAKAFDGYPKESDLELKTEELPGQVKDGEVLCETMFLSVDPYMRPYSRKLPVGSTMIGGAVAKIIASGSADWPVGTLVVANFGWRSHTLVNTKEDTSSGISSTVANVPPFILHENAKWGIFESKAGSIQLSTQMEKVMDYIRDLSPSLALGVLGAPGATAYLGTMKILDPQPGEVLFVNTAAGAVGSLVGQIGKIKGCKVIGCAGSDEKCKWVKELGFDHVFNYKISDVSKELSLAAPDGVDCYFDNVGGDMTSKVVRNHLRVNSRVACCGSISSYNEETATMPAPWFSLVGNQVKMQGFIVTQWLPEWPDAFKQMAQWIKEGKLKTKETVTEGFENMPKAFFGLFTGDNTGKAIVKV